MSVLVGSDAASREDLNILRCEIAITSFLLRPMFCDHATNRLTASTMLIGNVRMFSSAPLPWHTTAF